MKGTIAHVLAVLVALLLALAPVTAQVADPERSPDQLNTGQELPADVVFVKIDDDRIENGDTLRERLDRGKELDIRVKVQSRDVRIRDLSVEAVIFGDERYLISDRSENFDLDPNERQTVDLRLRLPDIADVDNYKLRIIVADRDHAAKVYNYNLRVDAQRHAVAIRDVIFTPNTGVQAGRALLAVVRMENLGEEDEEGVKVQVSIPALGMSQVDYIDTLEKDDQLSSEELFLRIPPSAKTGEYDVIVDVIADRGFEKTSQTYKIKVEGAPAGVGVAPGTAEPAAPEPKKARTVITVGPESQDVTAGQGGAVYPITLTNEGSAAKTYAIGVQGADTFATVEINPSNLVVVQPGETQAVYLFLAAKEDATIGRHTFSVEVKSGDKVLQQISLSSNVLPRKATGWEQARRGLEIALLIVIVMLIILGLVVALRKSKKADEEPVTGQTYY